MTHNELTNPLYSGPFVKYLPAVLTCVVLCCVPGAMLMSCGSIFYSEIAADLGVAAEQVTLYMTIMMVSVAIISPLVGRAMDRLDMRLILSVAVIVEAICFFLFSTFTAVWQFWVAGVFLSICSSCLLMLNTPTIINRWFAKYVGLIIGICFAFTGIGGALFIMVGQAIMDAAGWRTAYLVYAAIIVVVCLPFTLFAIRSYPRDRGLLPYGTEEISESENLATQEATSVRPDIAMKSPAFWIVGLFGGLVNMTILVATFFPVYVNKLASRPETFVIVSGALLTTIAMIGQAIGKVGIGFMSDLSVKRAIALAVTTGLVGIFFCWFGAQTALLPIGGFIFGFFYASASVLVSLLSRHVFGSGKHFTIIYSRIFVFVAAFQGIGNFIWPFLANNMGGFSTVFAVAAAVIVIVAALGIWGDSFAEKLPRE